MASARQLDLLAWPAVHAAQLRADEAEAERLEALHRYRLAPHGERDTRLNAYRRATAAALAAEVELTRAIEEVAH